MERTQTEGPRTHVKADLQNRSNCTYYLGITKKSIRLRIPYLWRTPEPLSSLPVYVVWCVRDGGVHGLLEVLNVDQLVPLGKVAHAEERRSEGGETCMFV